jgi:amino acid transporter
MNQRRIIVLGVGIFVLLNLSLQIFLIMVGLEAWINFETGIAWAAAFTSVGLAAVSLLLYRYLSGFKPRPRPDVRHRRVSGHAPSPDAAAGTSDPADHPRPSSVVNPS